MFTVHMLWTVPRGHYGPGKDSSLSTRMPGLGTASVLLAGPGASAGLSQRPTTRQQPARTSSERIRGARLTFPLK